MVYDGAAMSFSAFNRNGRKEMTEQDIEDMKNVYSYAIKTLVSRRNMLQKKSETEREVHGSTTSGQTSMSWMRQ